MQEPGPAGYALHQDKITAGLTAELLLGEHGGVRRYHNGDRVGYRHSCGAGAVTLGGPGAPGYASTAVQAVAVDFFGVMDELSAVGWALKQVEAVREEPAKRLELLERTYHGPTGRAPRLCRSEMGFRL